MNKNRIVFERNCCACGWKPLAAVLAIAMIAACSGGDLPPAATPAGVPGGVTSKQAPMVVQRSNGAMTVDLRPLPLRVGGDIWAVPQENPAAVSYAWYHNGQLLPEVNGDRLLRASFQRGDEIKAVIVAGALHAEATTVVANSPPSVVKVSLVDDRIYRGVDVTVVPEAVDADGDSVSFAYLWSINGEEKSFETAATLSGENFDKGDRIGLKVVPNDGFEDGVPFTTEEFIVPNGPPSIVSKPPGFSGSSYSYRVQAFDPDADPLIFRLETGPPGMSIDAVTGTLIWPVSADVVGTHDIEIAVTDGDGASDTQAWQLTIAIGTGGKEN